MQDKARMATLATVCGVLAFAHAPLSLAADLPIYGGPAGDTAYRIECPPHALLTGFTGRGDAQPADVGIECRQRDASGKLGALARPVVAGVAGRSPVAGFQRTSCATQSVVYTVNFLFTRNAPTTLSWLRARCADVIDSRRPATEFSFPAADTPQLGDSIQDFPGSGWQSCPAGELPAGIHGTSRAQVDSIGLICRPVNAPTAAAGDGKPALSDIMRSPFGVKSGS